MQKSMIITNAMLLPRQAAARIGVTAGTLSIWRCTGRYDLPYVKAGSRVRYRASDVEAFIQRRTRNNYIGPEAG